MKKWLFVVGSLIAVGCVGAGIAYAVIPSGGMITGCYAKTAAGLMHCA